MDVASGGYHEKKSVPGTFLLVTSIPRSDKLTFEGSWRARVCLVCHVAHDNRATHRCSCQEVQQVLVQQIGDLLILLILG